VTAYGDNAEQIVALNGKVTQAIWRTQRLDADSPEARQAFAVVSGIEEELASLLPYDCVEGVVARIGAVTASIDADDLPRAKSLIERYLVGAPEDVAEELAQLAKEVSALTTRTG